MKYEDAVRAGVGVVCRYRGPASTTGWYCDDAPFYTFTCHGTDPIMEHDATVETHPEWDKHDDWFPVSKINSKEES